MSILKQIWLSISRRWKKTLVIFLTVFLLGDVLCASLSIYLSCNQLKNDFITSLGVFVEIKKENGYEISSVEEYDKERNRIIQEINKLDKDSILYEDISFKLNGYNSSDLITNTKFYEQNKQSYQIPVTLYGTNMTIPFDQVKNIIHMTKGRGFSQTELNNNEKVAIVSELYKISKKGKVSNIQLGDVIHLSVENSIQEFKVVGLFKPAEVLTEEDSYKVPYKVYVPNKTLMNLEPDLKNHQRIVEYFGLKLSTPKDTMYFKENFNFEVIDPNHYKIIYSEDVYSKIALPLESLESIATLFLTISSTAVVLILSIILFIYVRERKYEFGVMVALGESKSNLIFKMLLEVFLIVQIAITISMVSGNKLGEIYSSILIENQANSLVNIAYGFSAKELIHSYEINMNHSYLIFVYLLMNFDAIISSLLPSAYILRLNAKELLMK